MQTQDSRIAVGEQSYLRFKHKLEEEVASSPTGPERREDFRDDIDLWEALVQARIDAELSEADMVERANITKADVARIEQTEFNTCKVESIRCYARAVGKRVRITLV